MKEKGKRRTRKKYLIIIPVVVILLAMGCVVYLSMGQYKAKESASVAMKSDEKVLVNIEHDYIFFDGNGTQEALIFYPGAKVETSAYAPLLRKLAESGTDCFAVKCPFNFAMFAKEKATKIMKENSYESWYIGGHSLGGVVAGMYANKHLESFDGLLLLASYTTKPVLDKEGFSVLSIYGDKDEVLNIDKLIENRKSLPEGYTEVCIEGANHAQFGDYGKQAGDGVAEISPEEQIDAVVDWWKKISE